jgi:diguanylate cyclase (GGDEF)-like protein/PAS domain S-box-containing protein
MTRKSIKMLLVVEDSPRDARLVREMFNEQEPQNTQLTHVACMREAEKHLAEYEVDIILLDLGLPDAQGLEAVRRAHAAAPRVPLVVLTALDDEAMATQALQVGAQDYLIKGQIDTRGLLRAVHYAIERSLAEKALRESELRFRQLAETIRDVFFIIDLTSSQIFYVSPAYEEIWGRSCESLYGQPGSWTDSIHPDDRDQVLEKFAERRIAGFDYEYRILRPDGGLRWVRARGFPVLDERGKPYRIAGVAADITQSKRAEEELRESERRFSDLLDNVQLVSLMLDRDARITYCNDYLLRITGWTREEALGRSWFELFLPLPHDALKEVFSTLLAGAPEGWHHENEILTRSGARRLIRWNNSVLRSAAGEVIGTASIGEDITEKAEAVTRIRRLNRIYAVLSGINTVIIRVSNRDELFRDACRIAVEAGQFSLAWIALVDREAMQLTPVAWHGERGFLDLVRNRLSLKDSPEQYSLSVRAAQEKRALVSNDVRNDPRIKFAREHALFNSRSVGAFPILAGDDVVAVLVLHAAETGFFDDEEMKLLRELAGDISFALDHINKAKRLDYLAYYDVLTGLANRALFMERLQQKLVVAGGAEQKTAVFVIDVDRFRTINDAFGRQTGDELLKQIAQRLVVTGGEATRFARIGADRFAIFAAELETEEKVGRYMEERFTACFGPPYQVGDRELRISAKVGIAVYPNDGADGETLYRNAEVALKKAKSSGDRYLFYTQKMTERIAEKLGLENKLRQAVEKEEFVLHYQPKVDLENRSIVGVEALIRWQSPELGLVPPMKFIPLMEETGMILEVGAWALSKAVADHSRWMEMHLPAPRVAVNVSAIQLRNKNFFKTVKEAIRHGANPPGIDLEITESMVMEDIEGNIRKLKEIRGLGVSIAIDDFGTGYSSLAYLAKLPVQTLKIDRSFVITMLEDPDTMTLVETIISLAHSLRLKVVAEGVDAEAQAVMLRRLRCDEMQGYLFSKPVSFDALTALLKKAEDDMTATGASSRPSTGGEGKS